MSEIWHASIQGVPWDAAKMIHAVKHLRNRATVSFRVGADTLEDLVELDARVFAKRPDLILFLSTADEKTGYSEELLATLASLKHVAALQLNLREPHDLSMLGSMTQLQFLNISSPKKPLELAFIQSCKQLNYLELHGKFKDLEPIAECIRLETLVLNCSIEKLDFVNELPLIKYLSIDSCDLKGPIEVLAHSNVSILKLSSVRNMTNIDPLGQLTNLEFLRLSLPKVESLCDFSKLDKLRQLELDYMKALRDIQNLWTAKRLEALELKEINTAVKADALDPLKDMERLRQIDFRFIDTGKRRNTAMREQFEHAGKAHLLYDNIPEAKRIRSMAIEHLTPILT
ncbi:hypothetical protein D3P09_10940 [Paenibacillus pinisoli]|uniref:Leucine-rich repeat domain-containing protein n=1 Tax=Paenibacillus pinisoli TaxID=1276110 RepID=A0A3A6PKS6_9BACL|nr:hypothetical protein [Paenibacillus pinisoli]RJX39898.1 hypothetical protein D3P09_10940 [Paenibacillus pinisoli]